MHVDSSRSVPSQQNAGMKMSLGARSRMLGHEKVVLGYYNDMGKQQGQLHLGRRHSRSSRYALRKNSNGK